MKKNLLFNHRTDVLMVFDLAIIIPLALSVYSGIGETPSWSSNAASSFRIHIPCLIAVSYAQNSAIVDDGAIMDCFLLLQAIGLPWNIRICASVDFPSGLS